MSTVEFKFGEPKAICFIPDKHTPVLKVLAWYKTADGRNKWCDTLVPNNAASSSGEAIEDALRYATQFVRDRWFLVEVTTPMSREYGEMRGGHRVLRAVRPVEPAKAVAT